MQQKILIAGGSHADIPIIEEAKKLGLYIITSGNKADDFGHKYSDLYSSADFSNKEEIFNIAKQHSIDYICASANDFSALSVSYTAEKLNLHGHDNFKTTEIIHHKDKYRQFAIKNNILTPNAFSFSNEKEVNENYERFVFPLIVKPVDLTGGKGVNVVYNLKELKLSVLTAFEKSKAKRIVVEEFISGTRHGFSAILYDKKVVFHFTDNEHYYLNQYLVSAASTPSVVSDTIIKELINTSEKIAQILDLKDGIFHVQFIVSNNKPYIIEICRRTPGDLYIKLVKYATGINYPEIILKGFLGKLKKEDLSQKNTNGFYTRHCIMSNKKGVIKTIEYSNEIKNNIVEEFLWWKEDDIIIDPFTYKSGIVFLKFNSIDEMLDKTENMQELIKVKLK